ncbi:MAG TPA: hypothetical protein VFB62_05885 [Polyangiaceae bacterium]|nr:hypothetical protein [Polyangiaceae bacterium]
MWTQICLLAVSSSLDIAALDEAAFKPELETMIDTSNELSLGASIGPTTLNLESDLASEVSVDVLLQLSQHWSLAAGAQLGDGVLGLAGAVSWQPHARLEILVLAGDAVRDAPFESREILGMTATRVAW